MAILEAIPKYKQMKEIILERLFSGEYPQESKFPSENDLVREFGVSKHTVLRALGELVNEDYLYRKQGSGTYVKPQKRKSSKKNQTQIAVIHYGKHSGDMTAPSIGILTGLEAGMREENIAVTFTSSDGKPGNEMKIIKRLAGSVAGFALITHFRKGEKNSAIDLLKKQNIPFVSLLAYPNELYEDNINFVAADDFQGGYEATKHLVNAGCETVFALIPEEGKFSIVNYDKRLEGYFKALKSSGIKPDVNNVLKIAVDNNNLHCFENAGYNAGDKIIKLMGRKKVGIFCLTSDNVAIGLMKKLNEKGIDISERAAICGFDNNPESNEWSHDLTSVDVSHVEIGRRGARILLDNIDAGSLIEPRGEVLPTKIIKRATSN